MRFTLPDTFDMDRSDRYVLSLRLQVNGCSFALYDPLVEGSFHYQEVQYNKKQTPITNLKEFFFDNPFLALPYKRLFVICCSSQFTCVPSVIYEEEDKEKIYAFNLSEQGGKILAHALPVAGMHLVYSLDTEIYEFLHRSLLNARFIHHTAPMITFFQDKLRMGYVKRMLVNPQEGSVDILCYAENGLLMVNTFPCKGVEDMVFYVLYAWKHLRLNQLKDQVLVAGERKEKDQLIEVLSQYIKHILPYEATSECLVREDDIKTIPFDQLSLSLCEL